MRIAIVFLAFLLTAGMAHAQSGAQMPAGPGADAGQPKDSKSVPSTGQDVPTRSFGQAEHFVLPSGNIGCTYVPEGGTDVYQPADGGPELSCDRVQPVYLRAILGRGGKAVVHSDVADQGCCGAARVLQYGEVWYGGPFTCYSERTGLTCERSDGHSFLLSRARVRAD